jgi:predicted amidohydrolase YtcJ
MSYRIPLPTIFILMLMLLSCKDREKADRIFYNAVIWTGDTANAGATVLGLKGNRIIYVGKDSDEVRGERTEMTDLSGKMIVPGFIDNHTHFLSGGYSLSSVQLKQVVTRQDFINTIRLFCTEKPGKEWVRGGDWDHEAWGGILPDRSWIDSVTGERPIFLSRYDGHMALANSAAMKLAGISAETPDPPGGSIGRDVSGQPTGIFRDEAMALIERAIPPYSAAEYDNFLRQAVQYAVSHGVTQVHDMGSYGGWNEIDTYQRAEREGRLSMRIYSFVPLRDWARLDSFTKKNGKGGDMLRWGGLKGFVDGSLGSTTAWFHKPYLDAPNSTGLQVSDTNDLRKWVLAADAAGLHVAVHAIGDRANDLILSVYGQAALQNGPRDRRSRVEHAQHLSAAAIERFPRQGVIASMHPYHLVDDGNWAWKRLENNRLKGTYAFRSLLDRGARLTFGSDWTVAPADPLAGMDAAVNRRTSDGKNPGGWLPEQKITPEEALRCYTVNNAYAGFQEDRLGKLKAGYLADLVILDGNLLTMPSDRIRDTKVIATFVDGKEVFRAGR